MKSIANQYRDLKEGKMSQSNFMRNVRMMMPQYITNVTSFKDAIRILKSKSILTELGPAAQQSAGNPEEEAEYKSSLVKKKSPEEDEEEIQALIDKYAEEESGKYTKFDDFEGGLSEDDDEDEMPEDYVDPDLYDGDGMDASEGLKTVKEPNPNAGKFRIMSIDGKTVIANDFFDSMEAAQEYAKKNIRTSHKIVKLPAERSVYRKVDEGFYGWDDPSDEGSNDIALLHDYLNQRYEKESGKEIPYEAFEEIDAYFRTREFKKDKNYYFDNSEGLIDHILDKFVRNRDESEDLEKLDEYEHTYRKIDGVCYKIDDEGNRTRVADHYCRYGEGLNEAKKKKEPKSELHPNQIHPQELRMGIKVELEHTDDLDKAKKIALDHLKENPFYYTALKLAGVESPSAPKVKAPAEKKAKKKKEAVELVDKANAMQKVKMPKDKINEDYESWLSQKKGEEARAKRIMQATNAEGVKFSVNDIAKTPDGKEIKITGFTTGKDGKMKAMYSAGLYADVYNLDDLEKKPSFRPGVDLGASFEKFKSSLEEVVREVIAEYYDGRDNLDAENEY